MRKVILTLIFFLLITPARAGLIFDNGTGTVDDTLVVQIFVLDKDGKSILADFDTLYVAQAYRGASFNIDTLLNPANCRIGSSWPLTAMFEHRVRAANNNGDTGPYAWWCLGVTDTIYHTVTCGHYYVNDAPAVDLAIATDKLPVPDSLWDTLTVIHGDVEALSLTGGGTEPETILVLNGDDLSRIQGARVTVRTLDQSTVKVPGLATDVNGALVLALDSESFWVEVVANNYVQAIDTVAVGAAGGTDTIYMELFDPGLPPTPGLCRVYGWIYDITGDSLAGVEIAAEIPRDYHPVKYSDVIITPFSRTTATDSSGYWYLDLIPSALLSNPVTPYSFTMKHEPGVIYRIETTVPDLASWRLQ